MKMEGVNSSSGISGMQHSEAMHRSHHGSAEEGNIKINDVDTFQKTEVESKLRLYNEKAQIVTK